MSKITSNEFEQNTPDEFSDPSFSKDDSSEQIPPKDVIAYNELRSCADLFKMFKKGKLLTNPDFHRDFIWSNSQQTTFIDSLIKALPIPSMCIALDKKTGERIVIDGRQRISTIMRFLGQERKTWRLSRLDDIDPAISGKTPQQIKEDDPYCFDEMKEHTLAITVLRYDRDKENHMDYVFKIFHRLNQGGARMNNQEIRNCMYGGSLNSLLRDLDQMPDWRDINHIKPNDNRRFIRQELILRFFAFLYQEKSAYKGGMTKFLNDFMRNHREDDDESLQAKEIMFKRVVSLLVSKIFNGQKPKNRTPANILYPVMVGIAKNIDALEKISPEELSNRYQRVEQGEVFTGKAGLANAEIVRKRLQEAEKVFGASR